MSETSPSHADAGPPATVDVQDPLPESSWFWRRLFVIALTMALLAIVWFKVDVLAEVARSVDSNTPAAASLKAIEGIIGLLRMALWLVALIALLYMAGASMEQITRLVQMAKTFRSGNFGFRSSSSATGADGTEARSETTIGPAPPRRGSSIGPEPARPGEPLEPAPSPARADTVTFPWEKEK